MTVELPPADLDAEAAVLAAVMIDSDGPSPAIRRVAPVLAPDDFFSESHRWIYATSIELYERGRQTDTVQVASALRDNGRLDQVGGVQYLSDIITHNPIKNVSGYARIVRNKSNLRRLIATCRETIAGACTAHGDDVDYLAQAQAKLARVTKLADPSLEDNAKVLSSVLTEMQRAFAADLKVTGIPTGLDWYDRLTLGLHPKQLTIVGARPGTGKTSLIVSVAMNAAKMGVGVLFFSLEMSKEEILRRELAMESRISGTRIQLGRLTPGQWSRATTASQTIANLPIWIDDRSTLTVNNIREVALGAIDSGRVNGKPIGLVIVDYLQRVAVPQTKFGRNRYEQVGDIARGLKQLSKESSMPVLAAAQIKRLGDGKKRRPSMDDLRESGDIENEADNVTLLNRPSLYEFKADKLVAELIIEKARHGRQGIAKVAWRPEFTLFENLPKGYCNDEPTDEEDEL